MQDRNSKGQFVKGSCPSFIFPKGNIPWNKGKKGLYKMSEETKNKMSEWHKNNPGIGQFKKGMKHTEKWKKDMSKLFIGRKMSEESVEKIKGKNNYAWKGEDVGYLGLHLWITRELGRPDTCEHCGKAGLTGHKIHWANKDHKYKRNLIDWIRLCPMCHSKYDKINNNGKHTI